MASTYELQPIREWSGLRGLKNLLYKENRAWWGTRRWWINALLWPVLITGLVVNMVLVLGAMNLANTDEVARAGGEAAYLISIGMSILFEFGIQAVGVGVIILTQDLLIGERHNGVAEWLLTKPVARRSYILAKLFVNAVCILIFLVGIPAVLSYAFIYIRTGGPLLLPFLGAVGIMSLHSLFYLSFVMMLGTFFSSRPPILGIAIGLLLGGGLLSGLVKQLVYFTPVSMAKVASLVANNQPVPPELLWVPILATFLWSIIFVLTTLMRFEKVEF